MEMIRATISNGYRLRLAVIAMACLMFCGWFLYDYAIGYPRQNEIRQAFDQVQNEYPVDFHERWELLAQERGWPTHQPGKLHTQASITTQLVMAFPCGLLSLLFFFLLLCTFGRRVDCDASGLSTAQVHVPWSQIDGLEQDRWKSKGIAHVLYQAEAGGRGRLLLDNWKFELKPTVAIYMRVAEHLGLPRQGQADAGEKPDEKKKSQQQPAEPADEQAASAAGAPAAETPSPAGAA